MAQTPAKLFIPHQVLVSLPWVDLLERLTAMATLRLQRRPEDAKQLAMEAVRTFLDPSSTVVWDYEREPDPRYVLGSILNGLIRNYVRLRKTTAEVSVDPLVIERTDGTGPATPEQLVTTRDEALAVLDRVRTQSEGDAIVIALVDLALRGTIDIDEQLKTLSVTRSTLYEARRRFRERIEEALAAIAKA